jgi:ribosomal protein S18 acetylase RimI-like enzyme
MMSTSATRIEMDDPKDRKEVGLDGVTHTETGGYERNYPAMLIGMLGVANRFRCRGLGKHLVRHAIGQARELARITACRFVNVDSMNTPDALKMYRECKFKEPGKQKRAGSVAMYYDLFEQH